jgi:Family of unknown function (DUF6290)
MPKMTSEHEESIQFRLPEEDKRLFQAAAAKLRISLSAWLRMAGLEKIERDGERAKEPTVKTRPRSAKAR